MNKAKINGSLYDVVTPQEYFGNLELYGNTNTAVQREETIYPVRKGNMNQPGFYQRGNCMGRIVEPSIEEHHLYDTGNLIDFTNVSGMKEMIEKTMELKSLEKEILTTPDNIFKPIIGENDSLEMGALKQAVIDKEMDIDKYKDRFGVNYNNDKKLFNAGKITMTKLKSIADNLDIKVELTLSNKYNDCANPLPNPISVVLNDGDDNNE